MNKMIHELVNGIVHLKNESNDYSDFEVLEKVLKLCGFNGFMDYDTVVSLKDIKKMNETGKFLENVNGILKQNIKIDELFTFIRNQLNDLCVPYEMIHKNSGNYLKLVKKKVTLEDYLNNKTINTQTPIINKYDDYNEFLRKNNKIYRSLNYEKNILYDLVQKEHITNDTTGIIRNKTIKNIKDNDNGNGYVIYESNKKCYVRMSVPRTTDIVRNVSCKLLENGIVVDEYDHIITIGRENIIYDKNHDIVLVANQLCEYNINFEITKNTYERVTNTYSFLSLCIEYDEIVLNSRQRTELIYVENYDNFKIVGGKTLMNKVEYLPIDYYLFSSTGVVKLHNGIYTNIKYLDNKNKYDSDVKLVSGSQCSNNDTLYAGNTNMKYVSEHVIDSDTDVIYVGIFKYINLKIKNNCKLAYNYKDYECQNDNDSVCVRIFNEKTKETQLLL